MDKLMFGYFCNNVPVEIIESFDIIPYKLFGYHEDFTIADKYLPSFSCSYIKSIFEEFNRRNDLKGIITSVSCDAIVTLGDIIKMKRNQMYFHHFLMPFSSFKKESEKFFVNEIKRFYRSLENFTGINFSLQKLKEKIKKHFELNELIKSIIIMFDKKEQKDCKYSYFLKLLFEGNNLGIDEFLIKIKDFKNKLNNEDNLVNVETNRIFLMGNVYYNEKILNAIEEIGLRIIDDFLCFSGRSKKRNFDKEAVKKIVNYEEDEILNMLALKYMKQYPCYSRNIKSGNNNFDDDYIAEIENSNTDGVIFLNVKYCDPNALQYYNIKNKLKKKNIPSLFIEYDYQTTNIQQMITRIEAFYESLS